MRIPLSNPDIGPREADAVNAAVAQGWISGTGPHVADFERCLAARMERSFVIATSSGTAAIELALRCLEIGHGDEVIVPAFTFAAPAATVLALGAELVLADVTEESWTIDPADVARKVTPRTRAIIAVDVLGHPCDYDALTGFGIPIIEDCAEAHGATYKDRPAGSLGVLSIFSFHANKAITTGEGGCVATDSEELADRMRVITNHGMRPERPYLHDVVGRNFRMTNLAAAVGVAQSERWDELILARNAVASAYAHQLRDVACLHRPVAGWATYSCWIHAICVESRDLVVEFVRKSGIDARAIWPALSTQSIFQPDGTSAPVAEAISARTLWLPTSSTMSDDDVRQVVRSVAEAVESLAVTGQASAYHA